MDSRSCSLKQCVSEIRLCLAAFSWQALSCAVTNTRMDFQGTSSRNSGTFLHRQKSDKQLRPWRSSTDVGRSSIDLLNIAPRCWQGDNWIAKASPALDNPIRLLTQCATQLRSRLQLLVPSASETNSCGLTNKSCYCTTSDETCKSSVNDVGCLTRAGIRHGTVWHLKVAKT